MTVHQLFHLGDILSITTGRLVSPDHMDGIYNILNFMTGDSLYTHQLIIACDVMREPILEQHPFLRNIEVEKTVEFKDADHVYRWLDMQVQYYGEYHELESRPEIWGAHDVLSDLVKIMSGEYKANE